MSNENVNEYNKEQAAYWRKRLNWYLNEATCEEYDEEQVQAIMDLLKVLDPEGSKKDYYTPEKGLERFQQTYEIRERIRDEFDKLQAGEVNLEECAEACREEKKTNKRYRTKHFTKFVTAAAVVVAMFLGGTIGIYADRDGVFKNLNSDGEKYAIVSSVKSVGAGSEGHKIYDQIHDVPIKYLSCLWTPSGIPENLSIYQIELTENKLNIKVKCKFVNEESKQFIYTTQKSIKESVVATDQLYDGFTFYCKNLYSSIEVKYFVKENEDYTEYIALFDYGNSVYSLSSNLDFETVENIVKESILSENL